MLNPYLTKAEVAEIVRLSERKVLTLPIPKVRVGKGRGKIVYNEADVEEYLKSRTEYLVLKGEHSDVQKKPKKMGILLLPFSGSPGSDTSGTRRRRQKTRRRHTALSCSTIRSCGPILSLMSRPCISLIPRNAAGRNGASKHCDTTSTVSYCRFSNQNTNDGDYGS